MARLFAAKGLTSMSAPQSVLLQEHSATMRAIAEQLRRIRNVSSETCPDAAVAWSRIITVASDQAQSLFDTSITQEAIETAAIVQALSGVQDKKNAEHSSI